MNSFSFHSPEMLSLLLVVPFLVYWHRRVKQLDKTAVFTCPAIEMATAGGKYHSPRSLLFFLRILSYCLLIVALARPVQVKQQREVLPEKQVAIVLAVDVSKSMLAEDLQPNRLQALKSIASDFIDSRSNDLIGLTVYSGESYTQCPLTHDHALVKSLLSDASAEWLADGTAIGMGLASAVNRLRRSPAEGKVIVLMTDGENNTGTIDPLRAAEFAKEHGISVYTIGIGTESTAPFPVQDIDGVKRYHDVPVSIDEELLKNIAQTTKGKYFRAKNNQDLKTIYHEIDARETHKPQERSYISFKELYIPFAFIALGLLLMELMLKYSLLRSLT